MQKGKINDIKMLKMVDESLSQVKIAEYFEVSKQAISKRIKEFRRHTTKVVVSKKIKQVVNNKLDAIEQLKKINIILISLKIDFILIENRCTYQSKANCPDIYKKSHLIKFAVLRIQNIRQLQLWIML